MRALDQAVGYVAYATFFLAMAALAGLIFTILFDVTARYVFLSPTVWGFDVSNWLNAMVVMLAAGLTQREGRHIRIDVFANALPRSIRRGTMLGATTLFLVCLIWLSWVATSATYTAIVQGRVDMMSPMAPPQWIPNSITAAGFVTLGLIILSDLLSQLRSILNGE